MANTFLKDNEVHVTKGVKTVKLTPEEAEQLLDDLNTLVSLLKRRGNRREIDFVTYAPLKDNEVHVRKRMKTVKLTSEEAEQLLDDLNPLVSLLKRRG